MLEHLRLNFAKQALLLYELQIERNPERFILYIKLGSHIK